MADDTIHDIKRIMTIGDGDTIRGKTVNQFLAQGWVLLHVYAVGVASDNPPSQAPRYVLGWKDYDHPDVNAILTTNGNVYVQSDTGFYLGTVDDVGPLQAESDPRQIAESFTGWLVLALWDFDAIPTAGRTGGLDLKKDEGEKLWIVWPKDTSAILPPIEFV